MQLENYFYHTKAGYDSVVQKLNAKSFFPNYILCLHITCYLYHVILLVSTNLYLEYTIIKIALPITYFHRPIM